MKQRSSNSHRSLSPAWLAVFTASLLLAALMAPAVSRSASEVDAVYLAGLKAFQEGSDPEAADLLMQAARLDPRCLAMLRDARFQSLLSAAPCTEVTGLAPLAAAGDAGPEALYRLGLVRKNAARDRKRPEGEIRKAGEYYLRRLVKEYRDNPWSDDAALLLVEDGLCVKDEGYPECVAWAIRSYEQWLADFGGSPLKPDVLQKIALQYLELARRYEEPGAWNSPVKAELCRGRALEIAASLPRDFPGTMTGQWGLNTVREIKESGKAYSTVPRNATAQ